MDEGGTNNKTYLLAKQCPDCGNKDLRLKISASLDIPEHYFMKLTKDLILEDNVTLELNWKNHIIYCPKCIWHLKIDIP